MKETTAGSPSNGGAAVFFLALRQRGGVCLALSLVLVASLASCRRQPRTAAPASELRGVGFELPGNEQVLRGTLLTRPPGREEAFLSFVAQSAPGWVAACRAEPGGAIPQLAFQTDDKGAPGVASPDVGTTARERCLAARAIATAAAGLPSGTGVTVQLVIADR